MVAILMTRLARVVEAGSRPSAVRVSLQRERAMPALPRVERKRLLRAEFQQLAEELAPSGVEVDLDAMSVSAQTVEATVPSAKFAKLVDSLGRGGIRVDLVKTVQVVPPF